MDEMQKPQKSCSQCRAKKTKCDLSLPRCSSCRARNWDCHFGRRQKPGPPKGFRKHSLASEDGHCHGTPSQNRRGQRNEVEAVRSTIAIEQVSVSDDPDTPFALAEESDARSGTVGSAPESTDLDWLQPLQARLMDAYSTLRLFPFLPFIRQHQLRAPDGSDMLHSALVNAACAITAHSVPSTIFDNLPITRLDAAATFAARARSAYHRYCSGEDHQTSLTVIKVAVLLALYQMHCSPGIKGWSMVGEAVRLCYDIRLDQLDGNGYFATAFMSAEEAEEARYLWWSVYLLDTYASATLLRPFAITSDRINTALVSTTEAQLKTGSVNPNNGSLLPVDPVEIQMAALSLTHEDLLDTQTLYLLVTSLGRLITKMRRDQLEGTEITAQSNLMWNTLATLRLSIPENFLGFPKACDDTKLNLTRIEIVLLLELQNLCLSSYLSSFSEDALQPCLSTNSLFDQYGHNGSCGWLGREPEPSSRNEQWQMCVQTAFAVVKIVRCLSPQELSQLSPTMASVFWLPGLTLVLHRGSCEDDAKSVQAASGVELLKAGLKCMGNTWAVAQNFQAALASLCACPSHVFAGVHMQDIIQSYTSPLISITQGKNSVNIPYLMTPYVTQNDSHQQQDSLVTY